MDGYANRSLQTLPAWDDSFGDEVGKVAGFSLHAGVAAETHERKKLERLCRYITRPAVSEKRLSLTEHGKVRYELKTPFRDGATHFILERAVDRFVNILRLCLITKFVLT